MELCFLGTGAARGWPIPWCDCRSCQSLRGQGVSRSQCAVLVDGDLLIDCGTQVGVAAATAGVSLHTVRHIAVTHAHQDHWWPEVLRWRRYAGVGTPLEIMGPPAVAATDVAGDPALRIREVSAGDRVAAGKHDLRVLAANHYGARVGPAVLYDITGPDGARVLYATDTGPLPPQTIDAVTGARFDAVLLDETYGDVPEPSGAHHDLAQFAVTASRLRDIGALTVGSQLLAIHLGHGNPPTDELLRRLAEVGASAPYDGDRLQVRAASNGTELRR